MPTDPQKARAIFLDAVENHTPQQWSAVLDRACASDADLRHRVEILLRAHEQADSLLDAADPARAVTIDAPSVEYPGTHIGPYKLLEQIGEGGFGVVFMAEQLRPVRRRVALKVIKPGMDSRQVIARFEAERQALALMDHPHIARVFDGGETASGRPYFVMELVRGVPVTDYCDQNQLPVRERLELFIPICQAVQHAHQKGIIHRDLKPSNVLVTLNDGRPIVKVIDFGIAKATGQQLTEKTLFTNFAQMIGTPLYMSPEQAEMSSLDVDTRTDIYSLGVLLYELLTGTTPFDKERLQTAAYDEIRRIIREEEPPRPSTRISTLGPMRATVSANRQSDPERLRRVIRGELDWVVMRCLEKDRSRRYETVNGLARDVERYLKDEPVTACPPAATYRFRKFARRNKRAMVIGGLLAGLFLVLAVGIPVTVALRYERDVARGERDRAEQEKDRRLAAENEIKIHEHLAQATALRRSGRPGQRFRALDEIRKALKLNPEPKLRDELRTEAIACLLLPDLDVFREWQGRPIGSQGFAVDQAFERYARADKDGNVSVRRLGDNAELCRLEGVGRVSDYAGLEFSPDGRFLVQGCDAQKWLRARLWRLDGAEPVLVLDTSTTGRTAFRPVGQQLALVDPDGSIRVHDLASGQELRRFSSPFKKDTGTALTWNPRQPVLAVNTVTSIRLVDEITGRPLREIPSPNGCSWQEWHPDGRLLAVSSRIADHKIYVWDTETGLLSLPPLVGHKNGGVIMRFNHAGDRLLTNDWSAIWRLWDVHTGEQLLSRPAAGTCLQFSPDDSLAGVSVEHSPGPCRVFQFRSGAEYRTIARHNNRAERVGMECYAQLDHTGRVLAVRDRDGIALLDIPRGAIVGHLPLRGNSPLCFEPKNAALLTSGANGLLRWPIQTEPGSQMIRRLGPPDLVMFGRTDDLWGSSTAADVIAIPRPAEDGALVLHRRDRRIVELNPQQDVRFCAVSPDGRWVATGSHSLVEGSGAKVWCWDPQANAGRLVRELPVGGGCLVGFSPDNKWLVTTSGGMRLWTVGTWQEGPRLRDSIGHIPAFTKDGGLMALDDGPGIVRLVVPETGKELARLTVPDQSLLAPVCFTPDGLLVTVGRETEMVHIFDLRAIRSQLADLGLDWVAPPDRSAMDKPSPLLQIEVDGIDAPGRYLWTDEVRAREYIAKRRRVLDSNPDDARACDNLAWAYAVAPEALRNVGEALRLAQKAVAREPGNPLFQNTLGVAYYRARQFSQAKTVLQTNVDTRKDDRCACDLYFLAMTYQKLGEPARAREYFNWADCSEYEHPDPSANHRDELIAIRAEAENVLEIKSGR
jgi:serine/threonine protein kinase/WD40 repeat protein